MTSYPIDSIIPELKEAVRRNSSVILHAPPGAGKTTRVPLALLDSMPARSGRIIMLEPRRIAAVSAARWMAGSINEQAGETIGYTIRFDTKRSEKTRIEVVTEGVLTLRIQSDPGLQDASVVIFDEFHERSIHADLGLALCLDIRKQLRPDLKILVMSATLDPGPLAALLGNAPIISSRGAAFPVEERYVSRQADQDPVQATAAAIKIALKETGGDILVFLPGTREIRACEQEVRSSFDLKQMRIELHPLYGDLPFEEQERAILPSQDQRKIVLATNIAETSLTIEGVRVVIDSGLARVLRYEPSTGMNRLVTGPISKASAEQRKGRAGRLGPGVCYRVYTRQDLQGRAAYNQPEILASDLSSLVLELAAWGVKDPAALSWLDPPPAVAWQAALLLLADLGALDPGGSITPVGRRMAALPLHPRLARLVIKAAELNCLHLGTDLAALLQERDIILRAREGRAGYQPDISQKVEILRAWRRGEEYPGAIDKSAVRTADRTSKQLLKIMPSSSSADSAGLDSDMVSRLVLNAYPDRICRQREDGIGRFVTTRGRGVRISRDSVLSSANYLTAINVDAGENSEGFIHLAAEVSEEMIRTECKSRIRTSRRMEWDRREGRIVASLEERIDKLTISEKPFLPSDHEAAPVICEIIRTTPAALTFAKEARQYQARLVLMKRTFPEEDWPDLSGDHLLATPEEWLLPWLRNIRTAEALANMDLLPALHARVTGKQARLLDERMPLSLPVPSGSRVKLDYAAGELPVLAVKLQEMFGLAETPLLAGGRVKVLLHLLSPAGRPVQITHDLKSFWNTGYPLVKKDLKGRYPRHPWPDDPWNAVPTRRAKKRQE